jgi:hypothetical protein
LRGHFARSIVKVVLHKLTTIFLLIALFGANTAMASICEAYCAGSGKKHADHRHIPATRNSSPHHHTHAQQGRDCSGCLRSSTSVQLPPCGGLTQFQALQKSSRIFSNDRAVAQIDVVKSSTGYFFAAIESERFSTFHPPPKLSNFEPALVSLRI